mmetsp:Transcript_2195/g.6541  ORF Transcript_2195/g.6541 Transcript_2195/m.6541 type:complete len:215 (-) Transcript_2195:12-656(-)
MGSTSDAMHTILAFLFSTRYVTCLRPNFTTLGALVAGGSWPAALASARPLRRSALVALSSGWYFMSSLKHSAAWFLSRVVVNWLSAGGTLRRSLRIFFCLWSRTYRGHLTKRLRSRVGRMSPPTRKFLGVLWKSGSTFFSTGLGFSGAAFFLDGILAAQSLSAVSAVSAASAATRGPETATGKSAALDAIGALPKSREKATERRYSNVLELRLG